MSDGVRLPRIVFNYFVVFGSVVFYRRFCSVCTLTVLYRDCKSPSWDAGQGTCILAAFCMRMTYILISSSTCELQKMINVCVEEITKIDMHVNAKKCSVVRFGCRTEPVYRINSVLLVLCSSAVYSTNSKGPRTDRCGTPYSAGECPQQIAYCVYIHIVRQISTKSVDRPTVPPLFQN